MYPEATTRQKFHTAVAKLEYAMEELTRASDAAVAARKEVDKFIDTLCPLPSGEPVSEKHNIPSEGMFSGKIALIKALRDCPIGTNPDTGKPRIGLREAKEAVDAWQRDQARLRQPS